MKSFFRQLGLLFANNWGLKLLSLVLAVAVYYLIRGTPESKSAAFPLPQGVITNEQPGK